MPIEGIGPWSVSLYIIKSSGIHVELRIRGALGFYAFSDYE